MKNQISCRYYIIYVAGHGFIFYTVRFYCFLQYINTLQCFAFLYLCIKAEVGKLRPAGRMRPVRAFFAACRAVTRAYIVHIWSLC